MGEQQERRTAPSGPQPKAGRLARWRERRRRNSARAADIGRRADDAFVRNRANSSKYGRL